MKSLLKIRQNCCKHSHISKLFFTSTLLPFLVHVLLLLLNLLLFLLLISVGVRIIRAGGLIRRTLSNLLGLVMDAAALGGLSAQPLIVNNVSRPCQPSLRHCKRLIGCLRLLAWFLTVFFILIGRNLFNNSSSCRHI